MSKPREFWIAPSTDTLPNYIFEYKVDGCIHVCEVLDNPTPSKDEEIKRLTSERDEMIEVLRFYAAKETWRSLTDGSPWGQFVALSRDDTESVGHPDYPTILTGGKRARELLNRLEDK